MIVRQNIFKGKFFYDPVPVRQLAFFFLTIIVLFLYSSYIEVNFNFKASTNMDMIYR